MEARIDDFFGLKVERMGRPEWATPKEIKSIWEFKIRSKECDLRWGAIER